MKQCGKFILGSIFGLLLLFLTLPVKAQIFQFTTVRKRENINFSFVKNLIIIPVTINGKGPFNFILDTGVSFVIITDPKLLSSLDILNYRNTRITGLGERDALNAYITPSVNIKISSDIEGTMPAAILQNDIFDLSGLTGMPIHGLIGYEFFSSFIVKIRYNLKSLTIYKNETAYIPRKGSKLPMSIEGRKPYINSEIVTGKDKILNAKLIIDTGAGHPISLETNAEGKPLDIPPVNIPANLGVGLSGPINGYLSRLPSVKLGKFELKNVISAFPDYKDVAAKVIPAQRNGSIGNNILKRFDVLFDYNRNHIYLRPSFAFHEPFEHDMSGIQLEFAGEKYNKVFIYRVDPGSAADKAELKAGDEILAINFKPVSELSNEKIETLFQSYDDRGLLLDIFSSNSNRRERVFITLKRRI